MPVNFGILQQPQAPQNTTQVVQTAPESGGDDLMSGVKGLLGGVFGKNPVSQANQAVGTALDHSPLHAIAQAILPSGMGGSTSGQSPANGLLMNPNGAANLHAMAQQNPNLPFGAQQQQNPSPYAPSNPRLRTASNGPIGDVQAASLSAYAGKSPLEVAQTFIGTGRQNHAEVISDFLKKSGAGNVNIQNTPWCAGFANAVLKSTGHGSTGSLAARSFLNYGEPTSKPSQGDVVVFSDLTRANSPEHGHVGFYVGEGSKPGYIKVLGGNQSGSVSIHEYPASKVLGYRVPPTAQELQEKQMQARQSTDQPY